MIVWRWVQGSTAPVRCVWDDRGTGGREGSLWATSTGLLLATAGHGTPEGETYELRQDLRVM